MKIRGINDQSWPIISRKVCAFKPVFTCNIDLLLILISNCDLLTFIAQLVFSFNFLHGNVCVCAVAIN